jgi:hypothetical protein
MIEYRIVPVTRFLVTRFERADQDGSVGGSVSERGEYLNADTAFEVGYALAKADHERLGYPLGDTRITYPEHPSAGMRAGAQLAV